MCLYVGLICVGSHTCAHMSRGTRAFVFSLPHPPYSWRRGLGIQSSLGLAELLAAQQVQGSSACVPSYNRSDACLTGLSERMLGIHSVSVLIDTEWAATLISPDLLWFCLFVLVEAT